MNKKEQVNQFQGTQKIPIEQLPTRESWEKEEIFSSSMTHLWPTR